MKIPKFMLHSTILRSHLVDGGGFNPYYDSLRWTKGIDGKNIGPICL